ncbi:MAG: diguanylate cyclase [Planctomycetota bacterium]
MSSSSAERVRIAELEALVERLQGRVDELEAAHATAVATLLGLEAIVARAPVCVVILDLAGVITDVNPRAEAVWARDRSALCGRRLADLVPPSRRLRVEVALAAAARGKLVRRASRILFGNPVADAHAPSHPMAGERLDLFPVATADGEVLRLVLSEDIRELRDERVLLANVNRDLLDLVRNDPLTGLWNRREYERLLSIEVARAARTRQPIAVAMIDVDDFKAYNDQLGHPAGDACLRAVATAIAEQLHRPGDMCARYGGEEFVVLLPRTDVVGARALAERMRAAVLALAIPHPTARVHAAVTVSIGAASVVPTPGFDGRALIESADRMLYLAKRRGRNQVAIHEMIPPRSRPVDGDERGGFAEGIA